MIRRVTALGTALLLAGCAGHPAPAAAPTPRAGAPAPAHPAAAPADASATPARSVVPPALAYAVGLLPLASTGVPAFAAAHPEYDGRGVLIGILDSGIDPDVPGLITTSTGAPKILDLRDFSGEGAVLLSRVTPHGDTVDVQGRRLAGAGRIARLATGGPWYAGVLRELPLGQRPAADLNGNGTNTDVYPLVVVKATDGWVVFLDSNLNGSFEDEMPLHDYREGRQTISLGTRPITLVANFDETNGVPTLDFFFDTAGHGTHVAGIAAGHDLYGIAGFDGVAPGAQIIGLKIANNARGGITVNGSIERALDYAAAFAAERNLPLVLNLSFGVGNVAPGSAVIDSLVDNFLALHPDVVLCVSAGNDGPGLTTIGFPASADLAIAVGALYPGVFARRPSPGEPPAPDLLGDWSSRGGALAKPEIVTPGIAYSSVPPWNRGDEIKGGTSMAAPQATGLAARLLSAMTAEHHPVVAADVTRALMASATSVAGAGVLDDGAGVPRLEAAYRWLDAAHQGTRYRIRTDAGASAAFRRDGLANPGDTVTVFHVAPIAGYRAARFLLRASVPWLDAPDTVDAGAGGTDIPVTYDAAALRAPGLYTGIVTARDPADTLAGPLFRLVNTVIVPNDLGAGPLVLASARVSAGRVLRRFVKVPAAGVTLHVSAAVLDPSQSVTLRLYEPTGAPCRAADGDVPVGGDAAPAADVTVRSEDVVPGVYEIDVAASPLAEATVNLRAEISPVALAAGPDGVEASNPGAATVTARATGVVIGAARDVDVRGRGFPAETVTVRVPAWAAAAQVDVTMPPAQWNVFTDFGVTVFDSSGQIVSENAMNYPVGRQRFDVTSALRGAPIAVELFPAEADGAHPVPWRARVRVSFLLPGDSVPARGAGAGVSIVPGGRVRLAPSSGAAPVLPPGFQPIVSERVDGPGLPAAVLRTEAAP